MKNFDLSTLEHLVAQARVESVAAMTCENLRIGLSLLDHTSLGNSDSAETIMGFVGQTNLLLDRSLPLPATLCVYPALVESVGMELGESPIGITAVCGGFPSGLTYLEVKMLECAMAIENGADEIDVVINTGAVLAGDYDVASAEIEALAREIDGDAVLKVILETGVLADLSLIHRASMLAMNSGANFIKTSTGKVAVGATAEAVAVMCLAIKERQEATGLSCGIKISGGVNTAQDVVFYMTLVSQILGGEYINPSLMRVGSSRALHSILEQIDKL